MLSGPVKPSFTLTLRRTPTKLWQLLSILELSVFPAPLFAAISHLWWGREQVPNRVAVCWWLSWKYPSQLLSVLTVLSLSFQNHVREWWLFFPATQSRVQSQSRELLWPFRLLDASPSTLLYRARWRAPRGQIPHKEAEQTSTWETWLPTPVRETQQASFYFSFFSFQNEESSLSLRCQTSCSHS